MKRRPTRPASALPSRRTTLPALICSRPVQSSRAMRCGCTVPGNRRTCRCAGWKCRPCGIWPAVTSRAFTGAPKVCSPLRRSARRSAVCPGWAASCPGTPFCMTFPNRRSARRFLCPQVRAFPPQPGSAPSSWCLIDRRVSFRSVPFFHRRIPLFRICRQMPAY